MEAIQKNLDCISIDQVFLLTENTDSPFVHEKLSTQQIAQRPKYSDFIDWANSKVTSVDDISIITNSDIFFDDSILALEHKLKSDRSICVALARWEKSNHGTYSTLYTPYSQDSWIFLGAIRRIVCDFEIGVSGCDNRFLYELESADYTVINPALSIRSFHVHSDLERSYGGDKTKSVGPPYQGMYPHNLYSAFRFAHFKLKHPHIRAHWSLDWRFKCTSRP